MIGGKWNAACASTDVGGAAKPKQLGQEKGDGANDARYVSGWRTLWMEYMSLFERFNKQRKTA